jgi:hypothetical protein
MALSTSLADLRDAVRDRSDTVGSARVTNTKLDRVINSAIKRLYAMAVKLSEDDFTVVAVVETDPEGLYAQLPSDFLTLREIGYARNVTALETGGFILTEDGSPILTESGTPLTTEDGGTLVTGVTLTARVDVEPMERFQLQSRWRHGDLTGWDRGQRVAYRLIGPQGHLKRAEFMPAAGARRVVVMWYVPEPTILTAPSDLYYGRSGFEEWVIYDAAIAVMVAEESDPSALVMERERCWQTQIQPILAQRDEARPDRVVESVATHSTDWWYR